MYFSEQRAISILDRFFRIANPQQRAEAISEIARIFKDEKPSDDLDAMLKRLMQIWEMRIGDIEKKLESKEYTEDDILNEVGSFIRWIEIRTLPFEWRHEQIIRALKLCKKAPEHLIYIHDLLGIAENPEYLKGCLEIFKHILQLTSQSNSWYYRDKELISILKLGLNSEGTETKQHATEIQEIQEILLRRGWFEFLMDEEGESEQDR